ncbi:MAG: ABC transporter ATP-binding protein [Eubacterium sp.]|nr:ABC transporter ATP-binding protein [Eubacterium sp.]
MSYSPEETAVLASHVTKAYQLFDTPGKRLVWHLFRWQTGSTFTALDDVSFEVKKGEAFGIIGRNGSGKSTMLQILAGILKTTAGEVQVNGRVAALLELGSGFDPESTGYENIYMNAAILGVSKEKTEQKIGRILEFADIGDFAKQPVKLYSSGMYVRLAFAVAIHVDADILLIDEALAVGDVFFRQKCYRRLEELKQEGKTIILVSHGMNEVEQFCDRALLLDHSRAVMLGDSKEAVKRYYLLEQQTEEVTVTVNKNRMRPAGQTQKGQAAVCGNGMDLVSQTEEDLATVRKNAMHLVNQIRETDQTVFENGWSLKEPVFFDRSKAKEISNGKAGVIKIGAFDEDGYAKNCFEQGETCYLYYEIGIRADIDLPLTGIVLTNQKGIIVHGKDHLQIDSKLPDGVKAGTCLRCLQIVKLDLQVGEYTIEAGCATIPRALYATRMYQRQEEVNAGMERLASLIDAGRIAVMEKQTGTPMKNMFHGICDLAGDIFICIQDMDVL